MSIVGQIPISGFIYDLGEGTEWALSNLIDSTKVRGVADVQEAHATIQKDLNKLEKCNDRNSMELKGKVLHLGNNHPGHQHMLGVPHAQKNFAGEILKLLVNTKLNASQTCSHVSIAAKLDNGVLRCIRRHDIRGCGSSVKSS